MKKIVLFFLIFSSFNAFADWHTGQINTLGVGYDGKTIVIKLDGWIRNNCTCYSSWPDYMCLDKLRDEYQFEKSLMLSAKAKKSVVNVNIDEASCKIIAIYEQ